MTGTHQKFEHQQPEKILVTEVLMMLGLKSIIRESILCFQRILLSILTLLE